MPNKSTHKVERRVKDQDPRQQRERAPAKEEAERRAEKTATKRPATKRPATGKTGGQGKPTKTGDKTTPDKGEKKGKGGDTRKAIRPQPRRPEPQRPAQ